MTDPIDERRRPRDHRRHRQREPSAPAPSGSRPGASRARPPAPSSPTSTTRPCCCPPPRRRSSRRSTSTSSRSRWTSRSGCTPIGKIPGSFFRREGRPGTDAILTCRLIDRPLRPSFVDGLRNEIQIVVTVMSLDPKDPYDALAINAASASTQLAGLPFSGPIGGVRVALIDGSSGSRSRSYEDLERAVFDMVVAGRVVGDDVAIMMVEAEATDLDASSWSRTARRRPTEEVVAAGPGGGQAVHPQPVHGPAAAGRRRRQADRRLPDLPGLPARRARRRQAARCPTSWPPR